MSFADDRDYPAHALADGAKLSNDDIRALELDRARHALAYLKRKLGNDAMHRLIADDVADMTALVRGWVEASNGAWQAGEVELVVPGPSARDFLAWYQNVMTNTHEAVLRAGHPEHFVSHPRPDGTEVVENVGETELPWRILYRPLAEDGGFPTLWDPDYPVRFGAELIDQDGLLVGYTMHALRDADEGMCIKMTTNLPAAAPEELIVRHLHHYVIEFRNWARSAEAWIEAGGTDEFGTGLHTEEVGS